MARPRAVENLYGSANVFERNTTPLKNCYGATGNTHIPLGYNKEEDGLGTTWDVTGPGHAVTNGVTRSGKGVGAIIPALLTYYGSCVVIDPKGENAWATFEQRQRLGNRVVVLDPWDEVNQRYGSKVGVTVPVTKFNPLANLDFRSKDFDSDVKLLSEAVIISSGNDPHWPDSARELVSGLIAAAVERAPGVASFDDVRRALVSSDEELARTIREMIIRAPNSLAARKLSRFASPSKEISSIRSTAVTQTAILDAAMLLSSMETETDTFNLSELATGRATLFLVLPVDKLQTHGRWLRLILTLCFEAIKKAKTPPKPPVLFILDELGNITTGKTGGGLPIISQSSGLTAGVGIRLWCFFQDLNQLIRDYPDDWQTFLANADVIQVIKVNDTITATHWSKFIGTRTISSGPENNRHYHARPAMLPQEIMTMGEGEQLILKSGGPYIKQMLLPYYQIPGWKGKWRPNPLYEGEPPKLVPRRRARGSMPTFAKILAALVVLIGLGLGGSYVAYDIVVLHHVPTADEIASTNAFNAARWQDWRQTHPGKPIPQSMR